MENLIMVLLVLGWAIYTALKKSAARSAHSSEGEKGIMYDTTGSYQEKKSGGFSDFSDFLEKMAEREFGLNEEEKKPSVVEVQESVTKDHLNDRFKRSGVMPGDLASNRSITDEVVPESMISKVKPKYKSIEYEENTTQRRSKETSPIELTKEENETVEFEFDLRNAVLSQVILERKYF